jgi:hypothetical protein
MLVPAAELMSASVPEDVAIHQDSISLWPGGSCYTRETLNRKSVMSRFGTELHQAGLRTNESVPVTVRLDSLCPTDCLESNWEFFETIAPKVIQPEASTGEQGPVGSFAKRGAGCLRESLGRPKSFEAVSVVPEDAVFRAHPDESRTVLVELSNREIAEPFGVPEGAEAELLGPERARCQPQDDHYT